MNKHIKKRLKKLPLAWCNGFELEFKSPSLIVIHSGVYYGTHREKVGGIAIQIPEDMGDLAIWVEKKKIKYTFNSPVPIKNKWLPLYTVKGFTVVDRRGSNGLCN